MFKNLNSVGDLLKMLEGAKENLEGKEQSVLKALLSAGNIDEEKFKEVTAKMKKDLLSGDSAAEKFVSSAFHDTKENVLKFLDETLKYLENDKKDSEKDEDEKCECDDCGHKDYCNGNEKEEELVMEFEHVNVNEKAFKEGLILLIKQEIIKVDSYLISKLDKNLEILKKEDAYELDNILSVANQLMWESKDPKLAAKTLDYNEDYVFVHFRNIGELITYMFTKNLDSTKFLNENKEIIEKYVSLDEDEEFAITAIELEGRPVAIADHVVLNYFKNITDELFEVLNILARY